MLDLACGQGRVARELARRGATVVGIDISAALLERARVAEARRPVGIAYVLADAARHDMLAGEMFDGVVCNFGPADIDDLDGALATVAPEGGWFVFSILHPRFPGWDADAPSAWPPDRGYYVEGWWLAANTGYRGTVGANHRMLSTYLNRLGRHGLAPTDVIEPLPGADWSARAPGRSPVPVYLVVLCVRTARTPRRDAVMPIGAGTHHTADRAVPEVRASIVAAVGRQRRTTNASMSTTPPPDTTIRTECPPTDDQ